MTGYPERRMRRLRQPGIRDMVSETRLDVDDLVAPIFVDANLDEPMEIPSMPDRHRHPIQGVADKAADLYNKGINSVILFGVPETKDEEGTRAYADNGVVQRAIQEIKDSVPEIYVITDVCMCEYTSHGHCGIVENNELVNDESLEKMELIAVSHAENSADMVAPSCMLDGMVKRIRRSLDTEGYSDTGILSYSAKYHSSFYGPFRDAAGSAPNFGDRSTYQMDPSNKREAVMEAWLDIQEGADIIMVKPALPYLDVLERLRYEFDVPIAAYNVSGEYAMLRAAAENGWLDWRETAVESLTSIKRAGADIVITYFAEDLAGNEI